MKQSSPAVRVGKRVRTRDRLLVAVQQLLLEKQASEISIQDITERAGVVHATFYNYYRTPGEAFDAVNVLLLTAYSRVMDETTETLVDPAERVAASARQTMRLISGTPALGRLLFDAGLSTGPLIEGLRQRIGDDVRRGVKAGRFEVVDLKLTISAAASLGLGVARDVHDRRLSGKAAEGVAGIILRILGVSKANAEELVTHPLPRKKVPPVPMSIVEQGIFFDD